MHNALAILALAGSALGHFNLLEPLALGAEDNEINYPLGCCGNGGSGPNKEAVMSHMPSGPRGCRGHQDKFDSATIDTTWSAGEKVSFKLDSSRDLASTHWGGSCQVGFSFDKLKTTTVATSYPGACPHREEGSDQTFDFTVPSDIPSGKALFIWTFNNREGEFFESCAPVEIVGGSGAAAGSNTTDSAPQESETPTAPKGDVPTAPKSSKTPTTPKSSNTAAAPSSTKATKTSALPEAESTPEQTPEYTPEATPEATPEPEWTEDPEEPEACTGRRCHWGGWNNRKTRQKRALTWAERGPMTFVDFPGADCFSQAYQNEQHDTELDYPNPGDVVTGDGQYPLALPSGGACGT